jgi:tetratricopeptide (TPR) repeat protein
LNEPRHSPRMSEGNKHDDVYQEELDDDGGVATPTASAEEQVPAENPVKGPQPSKDAGEADGVPSAEEPAWLRVKNMANSLIKAGYAKEAASAYKEALDIAPSQAEKAVLQANLALAYLKLKDPRQVVAYCDNVLDALENGVECSLRKEKILLRKAAAMEMWGRHHEAIEAAEAVLKSEPGNAEARTILTNCKVVIGPQESDKKLKKAMSKALSTDGGLYAEKLDAEEMRRKKLEESFSKRVTELYEEGQKEGSDGGKKNPDFLDMLLSAAIDGLNACFEPISSRLCPTRKQKKGVSTAVAIGEEEEKKEKKKD